MKKLVHSEAEMRAFGESIGRILFGGTTVELIGDVGAGKTTFVKGLAKGLGIDEDIQSPSFTISRVYEGRDDLVLAHYDFYRLTDAGIMSDELHEALRDKKTIAVIEWADIVDGILPKERQLITFTSPSETTREIDNEGLTHL